MLKNFAFEFSKHKPNLGIKSESRHLSSFLRKGFPDTRGRFSAADIDSADDIKKTVKNRLRKTDTSGIKKFSLCFNKYLKKYRYKKYVVEPVLITYHRVINSLASIMQFGFV